jgi:hypothetical protein
MKRPYVIEVTFTDGSVREIDLEPELYGEVFEPLKDPEFFARFAVDPELGVLTWPNGADFAPEFLYHAGRAKTRATS